MSSFTTTGGQLKIHQREILRGPENFELWKRDVEGHLFFKNAEHYLTTPHDELAQNKIATVQAGAMHSPASVKTEQKTAQGTAPTTPKAKASSTPQASSSSSQQQPKPYDDKLNRELYRWLQLGVHRDLKRKGIFDHVALGDVCGFWTVAIEFCVKPTATTVRTLFSELSSIKKKASEDIDTFANRIQHKSAKLQTITSNISKEELIDLLGLCALLRGLPAEFDPIVTVVDADSASFDRLATIKRLREFEVNRKLRPTANASGLLAYTPGQAKGACNQWAAKGSCSFGDRCKYSHTGPKGTGGQNNGGNNKEKRIKCNFCKNPGHKQAECRKKKAADAAAEKAKQVESANAVYDAWVMTAGETAEALTVDSRWTWDTGASKSVTMDAGDLTKAQGCSVVVGTGNGVVVSKIKGEAKIKLADGVQPVEALHLPGVKKKLLSINPFLEQGHSFVMQGDKLLCLDSHLVIDETKLKVIATGTRDKADNLFKLDEPAPADENLQLMRSVETGNRTPLQLAHQRCGHANQGYIKEILPTIKNKTVACDSCVLAKSTAQPVSKKLRPRSNVVLRLVFMDMLGKKKVRTPEGYSTGLVTLDDATERMSVQLSRGKHATLELLQDFKRKAEAESGKKLQEIYGDSEAIFKTSREVQDWCREENINQSFSAPYKHHHNRVERFVRTVDESAAAMLFEAGCPPSFWGYATLQAVFVRNSLPRPKIKAGRLRTPEERFTSKKNKKSLSRLRTFGCLAYVHIDKKLRDTTESLRRKAKRCVLLGNSDTTTGSWRFLVIDTKSIIESADVTLFNEDCFPFKAAASADWRLNAAAFATDDIGDASSDEEDASLQGEQTELTLEEAEVPLLPPEPPRAPRKKQQQPPSSRIAKQVHFVLPPADEKTAHEQLGTVMPPLEPVMPTPAEPGLSYAGRRSARLSSRLSSMPMAAEPTRAEYDEQARLDKLRAQASFFRREVARNNSNSTEDGAMLAAEEQTCPLIEGEVGQQLWDAVQQMETSGSFAGLTPDDCERESAFFATAALVEGESLASQSEQRATQDLLFAMASGPAIVNKTAPWIPPCKTPKSSREAHNAREKQDWLKSEEKEMLSQQEHKTYSIVPRPNAKVHTSKFVYKVKPPDATTPGQTHKNKARFTIRGFTFRKGVDFKETYAPVARMTTERIVLLLITKLKLKDTLVDFGVAFLNGKLDEGNKIYVELPVGFENLPGEAIGKRANVSKAERKRRRSKFVAEAHKAIYGSPQGSNAFYKMLHLDLVEFGFKRMVSDLALFVYHQKGETIIIASWVDDLTTGYTSEEILEKLLTFLRAKGYTVKNLGKIKKLLGMNVERGDDGVFSIGLQDYIAQLLKTHGLEEMKVYSTPASTAEDTNPDAGELCNQTKFRSMLGGAMFACVSAKPGIAQAVGKLCRKMAAPTKADQRAVERLFGYLKGTANEVLRLHDDGEAQITIKGFVDASWADDQDNRRSTSGYLFFIGGALVAYRSVLQKCVAMSTVHAEYQAASDAVREAFFIFQLLGEVCEVLGIDFAKPVELYEDNQGCILLSQRPANHQRNKHIDLRYHYLREKVKEGVITLLYVTTKEQLADILTKALGRVAFTRLNEQIMGGLKKQSKQSDQTKAKAIIR
jgi:hypothetical protein